MPHQVCFCFLMVTSLLLVGYDVDWLVGWFDDCFARVVQNVTFDESTLFLRNHRSLFSLGFLEQGGQNLWGGISAAIMANVIMVYYVVIAWREDTTPHVEPKKKD
jgi:hypothetical protein